MQKLFNLSTHSPLLEYLTTVYDHHSDINIPKKYLKNARTFQLYHLWQDQTSNEYNKYIKNGNILQIRDALGRKRNVIVKESFFYLKSKDIKEFLEDNNLTCKPNLRCDEVLYYEDENGVIVID